MLKQTFITAAVSLALAGSTLIAADVFAKGGRGGHGSSHGGARLSLLERLDTNEDGVLTLDEFSAKGTDKAHRAFARKDSDDDDLLSLDEFTASPGHGRHRRGDLDSLDPDALQACMEDILGDSLPEQPDSEAAFTAADSNGDGSIDLDEFTAAAELRAEDAFAEIDADGDGAVTSEELDAHQTVLEERKDARQTCVAEQLAEDDLLN